MDAFPRKTTRNSPRTYLVGTVASLACGALLGVAPALAQDAAPAPLRYFPMAAPPCLPRPATAAETPPPDAAAGVMIFNRGPQPAAPLPGVPAPGARPEKDAFALPASRTEGE